MKRTLRRDAPQAALLFIMTALIAGCVRVPAGTYLDEKHPLFLNQCPSKSVDSPQEHAYNDIMYSLQDRGWVVKQAQPHKLVKAVACAAPSKDQSADFLKRNDDKCVTMTFEIRKGGMILAFNARKERMNSTGRKYMEGWIRSLERVYSIHRCYSDDVLKKGTPVPSSVQTD